MLVLSRFEGEEIWIGDGPTMVKVRVAKVTGGKVRVGVDAPTSMRIDRAEVRLQMEADREAAKATGGTPVLPKAGKAVAP